MKLIKRTELKVGDVFRDFNLSENIPYQVTELKPENRENGIIPAHLVCVVVGTEIRMIKELYDVEVVLLSRPWPESLESRDMISLATYAANKFVQEALETHSDICARTPEQNAQIRKLAQEARDAIDDYLMDLSEKDRPPVHAKTDKG